ncbi:putative phosphoesterase [Streptomyces sp. SAI-041]|nr:putative phosphoesterase [Streptomyces sp. SAI-041]
MRLLLMSDTHLPKRAKQLPGRLLDELPRADVVFHAGDWVDAATLDLLESRSARLVGVYGNNDGPELRARLPEVAYVELGGLRFAVVHETGAAQGREARCAARYPDTDVLVFGHSHIPWDTTRARRPTTAEPRLADRSPPPAPLHVHDRHRGRRPPRGRPAAPAAAAPVTPVRHGEGVRAAPCTGERPGRYECALSRTSFPIGGG